MNFVRLLLESCHLFVRALATNFCYALPSLVLLALLSFYLLTEEDPDFTGFVFIGLTLVFLIANTLYVCASAHHTLNLNHPFQPARLYTWEKTHFDFFVFIGVSFVLLSLFILVLLELINALSVYVEGLEVKKGKTAHDTILFGQVSFLLFSSKLLVAALCIAGLFAWSHLCKTGIRIPAYVSGYYLRGEEANGLTKHYTLPVLSVSLLFIVGASTLTEAVVFFPTDDSETRLSQGIAAVVFSYFILSQFHIALWVSLYRYVTQNYPLTKLVL